MVYEYLLDLNAYFNDENGQPYLIGESVTCWGEDEYDALVRQIYSHRLRNRKYPIKIYYKLSRIRPTGRSLEYRPRKREGVDFFDIDARPYIRGLVTRFMVRFLVSDTIEEIDKYKEEFERYLEKYHNEFEDKIVQKMFDQYNNQRNRILSGEVKPISLEYDLSYGNIYRDAVVDYHANHASQLLKMFGYRVEFKFEKYYVLKPIYYRDNYIQDVRHDYDVFTPIDLLLYWQQEYKNCGNFDENDIYGVKNKPEPLLEYIGSAYNLDTLSEVERSLEHFDIECSCQNNYDDGYAIWVFYKDYDLAEKIINFIRDDLSHFGYVEEYCDDNIETDDEESPGICPFCGGSTYGDILCPDCANNVD